MVLETTETNTNTNNNAGSPTDDESKAATIIQSYYRGFAVRNRKSETDSVFISDKQPEPVSERVKLVKQRQLETGVSSDDTTVPVLEKVEVAEQDSKLEITSPKDDTKLPVNESVEIVEQDSQFEAAAVSDAIDTAARRLSLQKVNEIAEPDTQLETAVPVHEKVETAGPEDDTKLPVNESIEIVEQDNQLETAAVSDAIDTAVHRLSLQERQETASEAMKENEKEKSESEQTEESQDTNVEQSESRLEIHLDTSKQIESTASSATSVADEVLWTSKHFETTQLTSGVVEPTVLEDTQKAGSAESKDEASRTENTDHQGGEEDDKKQTEKTQEIQSSGDGGEDKQVEMNSGVDPVIKAQEENNDQTQQDQKQPSNESSATEKHKGEGESTRT